MVDSFFDEPEERSRVKAEIVVNYFVAWSRIMAKRAERIGYFDFFAGPGRYKTGDKSTPLLILERALASQVLTSRLVTVFNDANPEFTSTLKAEIDALPGVDRLKYRPQVLTGEISDELIEHFEGIKTIPSLSFVDPWGYRGLSLRLIRAIIKDWGCEVVFFFNYNRINMGIANNLVEPHMRALLGEDRLAKLRQEMMSLNPEDRESRVRRALGEALEEMGAPFLIPFRFERRGGRVSHYICFVSKHPLGYGIMKNIMASRGVVDEDGVPLFAYMPKSAGRQLAFERDRPIEALPADLLSRFAGQTLTMKDVYDQHNMGTPFIKPNYKRVLIRMEERAEIKCEPDRESRKANTLADRVLISFPPAASA
ncbi:MAG: three-Cys-motif partner protein TcmP [Chloroflexota bacterium]|nr:three-Cys-motif partner protein TcmP [Chloroflexota bacterium]